MKTPWITDQSKIQVLDCTIRDGGLVNEHQFEDDFVRAVYQSCIAANIDAMEIGYKNSDKFFSRDSIGAWRFCDENDIRRIVGENPSSLRLACMTDAGKSDWKKDVIAKEKSVLDIIRVAFYHYQLDEALAMLEHAHQLGYEVWGNLMAVSTVDEAEVDRVLDALANSTAKVIVVVDSFGSMFPEQIDYLTKKYLRYAVSTGKEVGIHAHNNQQLAFANTIEAIRNGATRTDASMSGLGRGAGNCPMELLLGYLGNPKHNIRAIYECLENQMLPMSMKIEWGPYPEYMITGQFNQHPQPAIEARESDTKNRFIAFYDQQVVAKK